MPITHLPTHQTYFDYHRPTRRAATCASISGRKGFRASIGERARGDGKRRRIYGRPIAMWHPYFGEEARPEIQRIKDDLIARHGQEKALRMCEKSRNMVIFPNLVINDIMAVTIRAFQPTGPDSMDVTAWEMAPGRRDRQPAAAPAGFILVLPGAGRLRHPR